MGDRWARTSCSDGNWYRVRAESGSATGWVTAQFLIVDPPLPPVDPTGALPFGLNLRMTDSVNLRRSPTTTAGIVGTPPRNTFAHVMAGPEENEGYTWYQVRVYQYGDGWVINSAITPADLDETPTAKFVVGDTVEPTTAIQVRPRPGIAQRPIATANTGTDMVISLAPIGVTESIWYGVYSNAFGGGWVTENSLRETAPPPAAKFQINDTFRVTETTNLRSSPTTSAGVVATMGAGTNGTIIGGPRTANGYTWWQIRTSGGTSGWCIQNWLVETDGGDPPPSSTKFKVNDTFRVSETTNLRSSAGTSASVKMTMAAGTTGTITGGPTAANGYNWWSVRLSNGTTGWSTENWLVKTTGTPPPTGGKFDAGDAVRVTERANFRTGAGTSNGVIATLAVGTTGTILGGPTSANGYVWWQMRTSGGTSGWIIEDVLVEGTSTPPPTTGFPAGTVVRVTEPNLRMRSSTSTASAGNIIATLPQEHRLTIVSGPTSSGGYSWYRVTSATYGTGYVVKDYIARV